MLGFACVLKAKDGPLSGVTNCEFQVESAMFCPCLVALFDWPMLMRITSNGFQKMVLTGLSGD